MTLFEIKEKMATIQAQIEADAAYIAENAANPNTPMAEIDAKKAHRDEMQKRFGMLKDEHDRMEEAQRTAVATKSGGGAGMDEKQAIIKAKANFYRAVLTGGDVAKAYEGLGGIPTADADLGNGDRLLPHNMSRELVMEPLETNPLRTIVRITNITGYEEPKLGFTIEDADIADVTDKETAKEIEMEGDTITYGRLKAKVSATIKDTVMHGTDLAVVNAVEGALGSALAKREKLFAFLPKDKCTSDAAHKHMSFYNDGAIKEVEGDDLYHAIVAALADLADDYAANAHVIMQKDAYYGMIEKLANNSDTLFGSKPASILGYPVVFCDRADIPVVGDPNYYGINYDIGAVFETDKDAKKGEYYFVLTAWGDQQIRLKSAFRLAKVKENP